MDPLATAWTIPVAQLAFPALSRAAITVGAVSAIAVLIALSAFFASSEIAIFSLEDVRLETLLDEEVRGASTLSALKANPRRLLVTILVGNNVANIGMSSIATGLLALYLEPGEAVLVATVGVTGVVLLFGESAPKSYAVEHSESWALRIARPLRLTQVVMYPLVAPFDVLTRGVNRLMGSEGNVSAAAVTRAEVSEVLAAGRRAGTLADDEHRMLQRLLRFRNRIAKETMVPRTDVVALEVGTDLGTAVETCLEAGFTRFPVYEELLDEVVGTVHVADLLAARERAEAPSLRSLLEEPYVVPETKAVDELLAELRGRRLRMAVVVDEFGTTSGIVTIEDVVEEIVGEVLGEDETVPVRWLGERVAVVRGELNVHEVNEALGTDLPERSAYESVAGLVLDRAGRIVDEGEAVSFGEVRLVVETVERNRVLAVRVELPAPPGDRPDGDPS